MKKKYTIDEVINSLDGIQPAKAPDFFSTRLLAKMKVGEERIMYSKWNLLFNPVPVLALLVFLCVINLYTLKQSLNNQDAQGVEQTGIASFANEYNLNNTTDFTDKN